jgi:hypothetical protein
MIGDIQVIFSVQSICALQVLDRLVLSQLSLAKVRPRGLTA